MNFIEAQLKYPFFSNTIKNESTSETVYVQDVDAMAIPGNDNLFALSTMWADCGGDATSKVYNQHNCIMLTSSEVMQDSNMSATTHLFERVNPGPAYVLVYGRNCENDGAFTIYHHE